MERVDESGGEGAFCTGCGRARAACDGCRRPLDPPRYCARCGRRLTVRVTPGGFTARCRDHGPVPAVGVGDWA